MPGTIKASALMKRILFPLPLILLASLVMLITVPVTAREFTVMTHNVNNFFDLDGVAKFSQFDQGPGRSYNNKILFGKIRNMVAMLQASTNGQGPDVIAFQEFEYDFTPDSTVTDYAQFLAKYAHTTAEKMLTEDFSSEIAGLPVEALVLKQMEDVGLRGYHIARLPDSISNPRREKPHMNIVFSRFRVTDVQAFPAVDAREVLEVTLDVEGQPLTLFVNHWKSNRGGVEQSEQARLQNAQVLRERVDQALAKDPSADLIVLGDFNSQYNQTQVHRSIHESGINDILGSQGNEVALIEDDKVDLYNLWYELPREERKSDYFDDTWGTLMHMILSRGLYDYKGIQYVDNSFEVVAIPDLTVERRWGLPKDPHMGGEYGGGVSDHLPLMARFRTVEEGDASRFLKLENPGREQLADAEPLRVPFDEVALRNPLTAQTLNYISDDDLPEYYGEVFEVRAEAAGEGKVKVGNTTFEVFSHNRALRNQIRRMSPGTPMHFYGVLGEYNGKKQFVISDYSWLLDN